MNLGLRRCATPWIGLDLALQTCPAPGRASDSEDDDLVQVQAQATRDRDHECREIRQDHEHHESLAVQVRRLSVQARGSGFGHDPVHYMSEGRPFSPSTATPGPVSGATAVQATVPRRMDEKLTSEARRRSVG
jgi:hypothetical protein